MEGHTTDCSSGTNLKPQKSTFSCFFLNSIQNHIQCIPKLVVTIWNSYNPNIQCRIITPSSVLGVNLQPAQILYSLIGIGSLWMFRSNRPSSSRICGEPLQLKQKFSPIYFRGKPVLPVSSRGNEYVVPGVRLTFEWD